MKKLLFAAFALVLAGSASAAEGGKPTLGVGFALGGGSLVSTTTELVVPGGNNRIVVPINVGPNLRLEPFLGFSYRRETTSFPNGDVIVTRSALALGTALYVTKDVGQNVEMYGGGRLAILRAADSVDDKRPLGGSTDHSAIGFGLAAVGGAEYYFSPRFSLGVEAELGFDSVDTNRDFTVTNVGTAAFFTTKVFFN